MSNNDRLEGKRILLFSQYFFGYENKIAKKMREFGAEVALYDEMSVTKPLERAVLKISPSIFNKKTEQYYFEILQKEKAINYDYVLFIDCEMPTKKVLQTYKKTFIKARFCLHLWDSLENLKGVKSKIGYFDFVSSFDRKDSRENNIAFRPLFYDDIYRACDEEREYDYDLSFVGTIHSDRYAIIKKLMSSNRKMYIYPYLQSRFIFYYYKLTKQEFKGVSIEKFRFSKIDSDSIKRIIRKSRAVLDIQHPKQTGLTMRTLEMVGMKKKMVTTNKDIVNYDFFHKNNICVIDRENPIVPDDFYLSKYHDISKSIYEYYSIGQWVLGVLGEN